MNWSGFAEPTTAKMCGNSSAALPCRTIRQYHHVCQYLSRPASADPRLRARGYAKPTRGSMRAGKYNIPRQKRNWARLAAMSDDTKELIRFLRSLRAIREYTAEPVADDAVHDILEVARWSGSSSNKQPVELVVVRDAAMKQKISENGVKPAAGAALAFVVVTPGNPDMRDLEAFDDGRLVERLLLAAKACGLGANIGTLKGDGPQIIKQALGIPAERRARSVVTVGHVDEEARRARTPSPTAGRKPASAFVHWDHF
jgi:nitroreductase